jgi:hypothetical protein
MSCIERDIMTNMRSSRENKGRLTLKWGCWNMYQKETGENKKHGEKA